MRRQEGWSGFDRDIVPSIACTRPPAGGVAWQSTFDGENSYSHWAAQQLRGRLRGARQQAGSIPRIGVLWPGASPPVRGWMPFRQGLRESGLVENRDVIIELRYAQRGLQQLPELAAELVRLKIDVFQA